MIARILLGAAYLVLIAGCTTGSNAMLQTARNVISRNTSPAVSLNPNFRYLRVNVDGRTAFLALGDVDSDPRGTVEVWYSAEREVLRFQDGRLAGAVGLTSEWRAVQLAGPPAWSALKDAARPVQWTRVRDIMPGYRYGVRDQLSLEPIQTPGKSQLLNVSPGSLSWFEERRAGNAGLLKSADDDDLPPARYAVDYSGATPLVVYGEQCLNPTLCFSWQRWPVAAR